MDTTNTTQKNIIKLLTETHQNPAQAFQQARKQARTPEQAQAVERIAQALNININGQIMTINTQDGGRLLVEIDTNRSPAGWLILTKYTKTDTIARRDSITGSEFLRMWEHEQEQRNNPKQ